MNNEIENIEEKIEKKVVINEDQNTEKMIESFIENEEEDSNVINEEDSNIMNEEDSNVTNEDKNLVELEEKIITLLIKAIEIPVSRGVYTPKEIANVGKVSNEFNSQIQTEDNKIMISKIKKTSLNNFKILIEISISRGGYQVNELANIGDLYNYICTLL